MSKKAINYLLPPLPLQKLTIVSILILFFSCSKSKPLEYIPTQKTIFVNKKLPDSILKNWQHKDILDDSIPGISLEKAYIKVLNNKNSENVIIAVLDAVVDIDHEAIKENVWTNEHEIANNGIDDDDNGYIDDVNGWDFLGSADGIDRKYNLNASTRIVKNHKIHFEGKKLSDIPSQDSLIFLHYRRAKLKLKKNIAKVPEELEYANNLYKWKNDNKLFVLKRLKLSNSFKFTLNRLDSLKTLSTQDTILQKKINSIIDFEAHGFTDVYIKSLKEIAKNSLSKQLNIEYNDREYLGDDPNNLNNIKYGYHKVNSNLEVYSHGTRVTSVAAKESPEIKIMSLPVFGHGSTHDKDTALAIRYAVDNGAKVINLSWAESFSNKEEWLDEALKYAEKNDVIIVRAAGNDWVSLETNNINIYPNDTNSKGKEITDNFLIVGSSSYEVNENLKSGFSCYGKESVDLFAPGSNFRTAYPNNRYDRDGGSSLSTALVSKVAALLFSYYPDLTASQVKHILMDSGVEYTFPVKAYIKGKKDNMVPFNELSKSGKIVNAYNALIMADSISKGRN